MPRRYPLGLITGALAVSLVLCAAPASAGDVASYAEAKVQAQARHVPVLIDFATSW